VSLSCARLVTRTIRFAAQQRPAPLPTRDTYTHTPSSFPRKRSIKVYLAFTIVAAPTRYDTFPHKGEKSGLSSIIQPSLNEL